MDALAPFRLAHVVALVLLGALLLAVAVGLALRARALGWAGSWGWARTRGDRLVAMVRKFGVRGAAALVVSLVLLVLFVNVASEVAEKETGLVDERVRTFVQERRTPGLDRAFSVVTWLGDPRVLVVIIGVAVVLLAVRRRRRNALLAVVGPLLGAVTIVTLKNIFQRARPEGALALGVHTYSFPSGHATASAASLLTVGYVLARERLVPWWSVAVAAVLALLVGTSRVYLDAHWATDVAGGWAVGAGLALAGVALYERLRWVDRKHDAEERAAQGGDPRERRRKAR